MINYFISLFHYKPIQLLTRFKLILFSRSKINFSENKNFLYLKSNILLKFLEDSLDNNYVNNTIKKLKDGNILFLGHFTAKIDSFFDNKIFINGDNLQKYELSYLNFLTSLLFSKDKKLLESIFDKLDKIYFEAKNLNVSHPFWYPYAVSCRLINVFIFIKIGESYDISKKKVDNIYQYMYWDYLYLKKNIEFDSDGNHLLKNYIALSIGSLVFEKNKFNYYYQQLIDTLHYQIIPDSGMHYEKSIDYHNSILYDLYILYTITKNNNIDNEHLERFISDMSHFSMLFHRKEKILINDTFENYHFNEKKFLDALSSIKNEIVPTDTFPFAIFNTENNMEMILYYSDIHPRYCPAHLHDAISTYELWIDKKKFITDSGNLDYNNTNKRIYYRSSHAHNISTSLDTSQSVIIKPFRFGKRSKIISVDSRKDLLEISFAEVKNLFQYNQIKRKILKNNDSIVVQDQTLQQNSKSYIHLNSKVQILEKYSNMYILEKEGKKLFLRINSPIIESSIVTTHFSDKFYKESTKKTIVLVFDNELEYSYTYE